MNSHNKLDWNKARNEIRDFFLSRKFDLFAGRINILPMKGGSIFVLLWQKKLPFRSIEQNGKFFLSINLIISIIIK